MIDNRFEHAFVVPLLALYPFCNNIMNSWVLTSATPNSSYYYKMDKGLEEVFWKRKTLLWKQNKNKRIKPGLSALAKDKIFSEKNKDKTQQTC